MNRSPIRQDRQGGGLYSRVVETLGREIASGALPAGTIVYADQIIERFGISRSVVRESMRTLSALGMLESRQQVGTRVLDAEFWELLNPKVIRWRSEGPEGLQQQRELLELRAGVEAAAARLAADRMSAAHIESMIEAVHAMMQAAEIRDLFAFFDADARFHRILLEESGNQLISRFASSVDAGLQVRAHIADTALVDDAIALHLRLARAIKSGDKEIAARLAAEISVHTLSEIAPGPVKQTSV